jgi:uncharacterized protein (DUF488 family)
MKVYTIGFTGKTAEAFFGALRRAGVRRLLDVRLHNTSNMAGFTKQRDLPFFLREICAVEYHHEPRLSPSEELFRGIRGRKIAWSEYERGFLALLAERRVESHVDRALFAGSTVLLCAEASADHCHRRLVLEYLDRKWKAGFEPVHL